MKNTIAMTPELVAQHGLKPDEYQRILKLIGREPTLTELGIFSAMWNEHCSYKSSRLHLRGLPTKAPWVIQGPGENAGVIDIGVSFVRSLKLGFTVAILTVVISVCAGMAFRKRFYGQTLVFYVAIASLIVPSIITSLGIAAAAGYLISRLLQSRKS